MLQQAFTPRSAKQVAVDMDIVAEYGKDIETIYDQMKEVITREVQQMTQFGSNRSQCQRSRYQNTSRVPRRK